MQKRTLFTSIVAAGVCSILNGCAPLVVGGAAVATSTALIDRRSTGAALNDEVFEYRVAWEIKEALQDIESHITVTSYNGRILLTGEVANEHAKEVAYKTAWTSLDVVNVINELAVMPNASITQRVSDSALSTKVKTRLIAAEKTVYSQMKVTVDRGIVYLMGLVTPQENKEACEVAAATSGVKKVVSLCEILSAQRIAEMKARAEEAARIRAKSGDTSN